MRARHVVLWTLLSTGCVSARHREPDETLWIRESGEPWLLSRYDAHEQYGIDPYWCVGRDGDIVLLTTRMQRSPSAFACVTGYGYWHDKDVVGYAPTGRVARPPSRDGREWHEYRLVGGPEDSPRVAEAISRQHNRRLDRPRE